MFENVGDQLRALLACHLNSDELDWLQNAINTIKETGAARNLYLSYSLCGAKIASYALKDLTAFDSELRDYLQHKHATTLEISRIYMLHSILSDGSGFTEPVKKLIQISDRAEMETFLKFLMLLPQAEQYKFAAVEALRSNISTVFEAIAAHNAYPATYFNEQQWNQMYLKAAFIQMDLSTIDSIDQRANSALAQIISDYAHERWAASRDIDAFFWRPISQFLNDELLVDVQRLFDSEDPQENRAAALVCHYSTNTKAKKLLTQYPNLKEMVDTGELRWENLKN